MSKLLICIALCTGSVLASYDPAQAKSSIHVPPGTPQSAGSYYHYHLPVGGHETPYNAAQYQGHYMSPGWDHSLILWLLPLLLLLLAKVALLPLLLKALLLPAGLSLLALLLPLLMMGGMMMMMMMGGGMMMMPMRNQPTAVTTARTVGHLLMEHGPEIVQSAYGAINSKHCKDDMTCKLRETLKVIQSLKDKYGQSHHQQPLNSDQRPSSDLKAATAPPTTLPTITQSRKPPQVKT